MRLAKRVAAEIREIGPGAVSVATNVSDAEQVARMVQTCIDAFGRVDILVNGAGILAHGTVLDTEPEQWNRVLAVNLTGTYLCCRAVLPSMI